MAEGTQEWEGGSGEQPQGRKSEGVDCEKATTLHTRSLWSLSLPLRPRSIRPSIRCAVRLVTGEVPLFKERRKALTTSPSRRHTSWLAWSIGHLDSARIGTLLSSYHSLYRTTSLRTTRKTQGSILIDRKTCKWLCLAEVKWNAG